MSTVKTSCLLRSKDLTAEVRPSEGGRIASLRSTRTGVEFLTQAHPSVPAYTTGMQARFQDGPCAGVEECLPTVGACGPGTQGGPVPDHGDFWQLAWKVTEVSPEAVRLSAQGFSRPLLFRKTLRLDGHALGIAYEIENRGAQAEPFLYACHPLLAVDPGDRIALPPEINAVRLDYTMGSRLGHRDEMLSWPVTQAGQRLDVVGRATDQTADMFYTGKLQSGRCQLLRQTAGHTVEVLFDNQRLPYLGVWVCCGGWPGGSGTVPQQYAVALEPTTSPCNTLHEAQQTGSAVVLGAGDVYAFEITFRVS